MKALRGSLYIERNVKFGIIKINARLQDVRYMPEWTEYPTMIHHGESVAYAERKYREEYGLKGARLTRIVEIH